MSRQREAADLGERIAIAAQDVDIAVEKVSHVEILPVGVYLDPGESAVGTAVNVRHLAATPVGRLVIGEAEVTKVDGR
jgi:predicted thioesterase